MKPATGATPLIAIAAAALGTETTGLDATKARILRIGAVGILQGRIERQNWFDVGVDPGEAAAPAASRIHGSTDNRPTRSDIPQRPAIDRATRVTTSRSFSDPVGTMPNTSCSAAMPPSAPIIRPRR